MPKVYKTPVALTSLWLQTILHFRKKQNFRYLHRLFQTSLLPNFLWGSQKKSNVRWFDDWQTCFLKYDFMIFPDLLADKVSDIGADPRGPNRHHFPDPRHRSNDALALMLLRLRIRHWLGRDTPGRSKGTSLTNILTESICKCSHIFMRTRRLRKFGANNYLRDFFSFRGTFVLTANPLPKRRWRSAVPGL